MTDITLNHLAKRYGDAEVLKDINLAIKEGEFIVLVGPSGCGKSTLLRMIAGLEPISGGDLHFGDERVNDLPPRDRDIAMVFQSYALYPHMNVERNLGFSLDIKTRPESEKRERTGKAAKMLGLSQLIDRFPKALSGGQRQRVAMGRALVRDPKIFLFDEPLSNLDAALRIEMRIEIAKLHKRLGTTMIYVTHDQVEALTLADRIVVMNKGNIEQVGTPLELYQLPANKFVAGFIGSPKMNFVPIGKLQPNAIATAFADEASEIGIRPEHVQIASNNAPYAIQGEVEVVEQLGSDTILYLNYGSTELLVARLSGINQITPGTELNLTFDNEHIHTFDVNGDAISN
jgi:multiple sugar transport system ATP-binding protein